MNASDIRKKVTDKIVQSIEKGDALCWRRPWSNDVNGFGLATSLSSGAAYKGVNQVFLQAVAAEYGIRSRWFGTYNQIRTAGASVKKGERGIKVVLWKPIKREKADKDGKKKETTFFVIREFTVFSVEQTTGLNQYRVGFDQPPRNESASFESADVFFNSLGIKLKFGGNKALYCFDGDFIRMPFKHQFESDARYMETIAHECIHWCERRINFDRSKYENSYAFGELVAELGSCFLCQELGIPVSLENSTAYVEHWLRGMKSDTKFIFDAASIASKAVDFLLTIGGTPKASVA